MHPPQLVDKVNKLSSKCVPHFDEFHAGMFSSAQAALSSTENSPFGGKATDTGMKMKGP